MLWQAEVLGGEHPRALRTRVSLGEALLARAQGADRAEGAELFVRCEAALGAALDPRHPDLVRTRALATVCPGPDA